jgi:predicted AAA+ superfamily ATPase
MITNELIFRQELEKANRFWLTNAVEEKERYPNERSEVETVCAELKLKRITVITGSRRVGKSVLIKHIISRLIKRGVKPRNILYYSMEDPYLKLYCDNLIRDVFDYWLENIAEEGEKYIFFDEIHFVDEWYKWLKILYDRHKNIKICVSGSSSLILQRDANKYLRGRCISYDLWHLTFRQFLEMKNRRIVRFEPNALAVDRILGSYKEDFKQYALVGGFPEFFEVKDVKKWLQVLKNSVSNKAIYEDIATTFKIRNVKILEQILLFVIANQSKILSYEKINEVAGLKHEILLNYIEYLKSSYLIVELLKSARNIKEQLKSKKKFLCTDQGLRNALLREYEIREDNEGFIIENIVGMHAYICSMAKGMKIMYYKADGDVDFIVKGRKTMLIESKYRVNITDRDINKVEDAMKTTKCNEAYIITRGDFRTIKLKTGKISLIPALVFCLFTDIFLKE